MTEPIADVIDQLAGIAPGSRLDGIRHLREAARDNAQTSYLALFAPDAPGDVAMVERFAVAAFATGLHGEGVVAQHYLDGLAAHDPALADAVRAELAAGAAAGPYGRFPEGPLRVEDSAGPVYAASPAAQAALGRRLAAALEHAHMLVFHPRDAAAPALQALLDAGWTTTGIVTVSQLVAFLSFQIRVVAGLRALAAAPGES